MPKFFPSLRRRAPQPGQAFATEAKTLLYDYYQALYTANAGLHSRARPWPIERAVTEGYERVMWVFKAVSTIGENTAREDLPFQVVEGPEDVPRVVEDHPIARLLNGMANPLETGGMLLERLSAQLLLSKRGAFLEIVRSNMGTPIRLDLLPPGRTRPVPADPATVAADGKPLLRFDGSTDLISHFEVTRMDGTTYDIDPGKVRWFRKPHPIDPYSGVTPLESAGLSLELDHFARLYNKSFLENDGRPGTIIGIDGEMDSGDMERIDQKFGRGPVQAGVVTTIAGKITAVDMAKSPRDVSYGQLSKNSKVEILSSFGVPESQIGNAADRTYANAEAEGYAFWSITMVPHLSRISTGFLPDVEDGQRPRFNTDAIEVLQLPARTRREEMRAEVAAGLRSPKSYADAAGYGDEVADTAMTRALWFPAGRTPLPSREEDAAELGLAPADPNAMPAEATGGEPNDAVAGEAAPLPTDPAPTDGQASLIADVPPPGAPQTPRLASGPGEVKTLEQFEAELAVIEAKAARPTWETIDPVDTETVATAALTGALTVLARNWVDRTRARVRNPRIRKGTRHFEAEYAQDTRIGTKALDAAYAADEEGAADETDQAARPLVADAALAAAAAWLTASTGQAVTPSTLPAAVVAAVTAAASAAMPALISGAAWQARRTARAVADVDSSGGTMADVMAALDERLTQIQAWAGNAAEDAAAAATETGYAAAADYRADGGQPDTDGDSGVLVWPEVDVQRQWMSRKDGHVRPTHTLAHGQTRELTEPFTVGGALLRYPKDPLGPPGEVRNCRCRASYRQKSSGKFVARPAAAVEAS